MILGVDPGGTTGMCLVEQGPLETEILWSGQFEPMDACARIDRFITTGEVDYVAIERFTIAGRTLGKTRQNEALEIIGLTKYLGWKHDIPIALQTPSDAKNVWTDKRLRANDLWVTGPHARDSLRHALLLLQRRGWRS